MLSLNLELLIPKQNTNYDTNISHLTKTPMPTSCHATQNENIATLTYDLIYYSGRRKKNKAYKHAPHSHFL